MKRYEFASPKSLANSGRTTGSLNSGGTREGSARVQGIETLLSGQRQEWHDGTRTRVAIGKQTDGKYGLRVWDSAGVLTFDHTTA